MHNLEPLFLAIKKPTKNYKGIVFIDRDGVINNVPSGHLLKEEDIDIFKGVEGAIRDLSEAGFSLAIITNQSCVARGTVGVDKVLEINRAILHQIHGEQYINYMAMCPHDDQDNCACRKPKIGMITKILEVLPQIKQTDNSWVIGDSLTDVQCGLDVGMNTILVRTGRGAEQENKIISSGVRPLICVDDLSAASRCIIKYESSRYA